MTDADISEKQKELIDNYRQLLGFGYQYMGEIGLDIYRVKFKKQIAFLTMAAVQSYSEAILKLVESKPLFDKAAEILLRSLIEAMINVNYVYAGRSQYNALVFLLDSFQDRIDFADKHKAFWTQHLSWDLKFGDKILKPSDWDVFINERQKNILKAFKSRRYKKPSKVPDLRARAVIADNYLRKLGKLSEKNSLEKYYVLYYKYFSQTPHLKMQGLERFISTDSQGKMSLIIDGKAEDVIPIIAVATEIYIGLLKLCLKEFHVYSKNKSEKLKQLRMAINS